MEQVVVVSEENAASASQISTAATQLNSGMDRVNATSEMVSKIARELQEGIDVFKLQKEAKDLIAELT